MPALRVLPETCTQTSTPCTPKPPLFQALADLEDKWYETLQSKKEWLNVPDNGPLTRTRPGARRAAGPGRVAGRGQRRSLKIERITAQVRRSAVHTAARLQRLARRAVRTIRPPQPSAYLSAPPAAGVMELAASLIEAQRQQQGQKDEVLELPEHKAAGGSQAGSGGAKAEQHSTGSSPNGIPAPLSVEK